ncbi:hypothetical protein AC249_AIPGENE11513 [Exaiptasia diaphana]|nr:hypothetical protein AC249_AIPGENE11513 [Exaiptasia diaphana]
MVSSFPGVQYGKLHYRNLEISKIQALKAGAGNFDTMMTINEDMKTDLNWWIKNLDCARGLIARDNPEIEIATDASMLGWGAVCEGLKAQGKFMDFEIEHNESNINALELLAIQAVFAKDFNGQSRCNCNNATVANTELLYQGYGDAGQQTYTTSANARVVETSRSTGKDSPNVSKIELIGMQTVRGSLESLQISGRAADIIMASWREGTRKQYSTHINKWIKYCGKKQVDCLHPNIGDIIDFLTELFDVEHLSYSSLNTARSALSTIISINGSGVGSHPLVVRFLKGVYNLNPPIVRYKSIWDVGLVLKYLKSFRACTLLHLKDLSHKLVMLLAITTAQRLQTLQMLNLGLMTVEANEVIFCFNLPLKQSRPRNSAKPLIVKKYTPDEHLCVHTILLEYIKRTEGIRGNEQQLLISYQKPFKKISRDTISRWLKTVMQSTGVDLKQFKAHSTRSASTSAVKKSFVPIEEILAKAGWSTARTFANYYDKPVVPVETD